MKKMHRPMIAHLIGLIVWYEDVDGQNGVNVDMCQFVHSRIAEMVEPSEANTNTKHSKLSDQTND